MKKMAYKIRLIPSKTMQRQLLQYEGIARSVWNWAIQFCRECDNFEIDPTPDLIRDAFQGDYLRNHNWIKAFLSSPTVESICAYSYKSALLSFYDDKKTSFKKKHDATNFFYLNPKFFTLGDSSVFFTGAREPIVTDLPFPISEVVQSSFMIKEGKDWYLLLVTENPNSRLVSLLVLLDHIYKASGIPAYRLYDRYHRDWVIGVTNQEKKLHVVQKAHRQLEHYTHKSYPVYLSKKKGICHANLLNQIFLDYSALGRSDDLTVCILAHEWAHCYYSHTLVPAMSYTEKQQREKAADSFSARFAYRYGYNILPVYHYLLERPDCGLPFHPTGRDRARNMLLTYEKAAKANESLLSSYITSFSQQGTSAKGYRRSPIYQPKLLTMC